MAKEHIDILNIVKRNLINYRDEVDARSIYHSYLCIELDDVYQGGAAGFSAVAIADIKMAITNIFRPLAITSGSFTWREYGIAAMFEGDLTSPSMKYDINLFRIEVVDALIEDFQDEVVGCTFVGC